MIDDLVAALGLVAILEGLVLALAPSRLRDMLRAVEALGAEQLRLIGLLAMAVGLLLYTLARG